MLYFLLILSCFYSMCHTKSFGKVEGSSCVVDGYNGTCLNFYKCRQMIQKYANKPTIVICSYDGDVPIVCCTECSELHVENINNAVVDQVLGILWKNGIKAWDKCLDYIDNNPYTCGGYSDRRLSLEWQEDRKCNTFDEHVYVSMIGGNNAHIGEIPHMTLLGYGRDLESAKWVCCGSLISETFILTAAHCISSPSLGPVTYAALRMLKRSDPTELWQRHSIKRIIPYPDYKSPSKYHDIALLETASPVTFSSLVLPACLPVNTFDTTYAYVAGWGALGYRQQLSDVLQKAFLSQYSHEECSKLYQRHRLLLHGYNSTTQMCFGDHEELRDTCEGDSGGPLYFEIGCRYDVIGVTSYGWGCGIKGNAGMYTRVENYVPWIESIVWP